MSTVARRIVVHGRVQGVGYRFTMVGIARHAGVHGWVRNRRDGTVEAVVQGPAPAVEAMLAWARRGPDDARVSGVEVVSAEGDFAGFEKRPTD